MKTIESWNSVCPVKGKYVTAPDTKKLCIDINGACKKVTHNFFTFMLGNSDLPAILSLEAKKDKDMEEILTKYNMLSLYDIFESNSITKELIWELNDNHLKDMGLSIGDRLKYQKAKEAESAITVKG